MRPGVVVGAVAVVAGVATALSACSIGTDEPSTIIVQPNEPFSSVTVQWSVRGSTEASACAESGADMIDISVVSPDTGGELEAFQQTCETFETNITLAPGTYAVRARLVDAEGNRRTNDVSVEPFALEGNDELVRAVDFPADSFL